MLEGWNSSEGALAELALAKKLGLRIEYQNPTEAEVYARYQPPETLPCPVLLEPGLRLGKGLPLSTLHLSLRRRADYLAELEALTPEEQLARKVALADFALAFNLNSDTGGCAADE